MRSCAHFSFLNRPCMHACYTEGTQHSDVMGSAHFSRGAESAQALVALLLPTNFLYAFLYYTDMGAVTCIMASYLVGPFSPDHKRCYRDVALVIHCPEPYAFLAYPSPFVVYIISKTSPMKVHILTSVGIMYEPAADENVAMACHQSMF